MIKLQEITFRSLSGRVAMSLRALAKLLYFKPGYLLLAAASSVLFYELIFWFLNLGLAQYLFTNSYLTVFDKLEIIIGSYTGIFSYPFSRLAIILFAVSALQGVTISVVVYMIRHEKRLNKGVIKNLGGTGVAGLLSVLGLGCAACGTSIVTPILTFFFASSSVALAEVVGFYAALLALVVAIVTVYMVGLKLAPRLSI